MHEADAPSNHQPGLSSLLPELIGESVGITNLRAQVGHLLGRQGHGRRLPTFLLLGETGTGKGLLARAIHRASVRAARPLVDIDCAAIPETLLEAELFGVERGAFTDARQTKPGLFQTASGGTIFLDEVGLLPKSLQGKLLKVVEERGVRRLGSTQTEVVDLWVIAATNVDLSTAAREGAFREDLYHRLAAVTLILPPLRARGGDVLLLANHFLDRACAEYRLPPKILAPDARAAMLAYQWPGNVRELANLVERVVLMSGEATVISGELLGLPAVPAVGPPPASEPQPPHLRSLVEGFERERLVSALRTAHGNITAAAAHLGLPRNTLRYRLVKLGIGPEELREGSVRSRIPPAKIDARPSASPSLAPLPPALPGPREEIRLVSFLCAEVSAADDQRFQTERMIEFIASKVQSFGGRVEAVRETRLLATFGVYPCDDVARRAAYAATTAAKAVTRTALLGSMPPSVQIALHVCQTRVRRTHSSFVMSQEDRERAERTLDSMLGSAEPNDVVVCQSAEDHLRGQVDLERVSRESGLDGPIFRIVHPQGPGRPSDSSTVIPFVGRQYRLQLMARLFAQVEQGRGQVLGIVGEPGIGKSRLLHEFSQRLADRQRVYRWVRFVSYGPGTADLTVVEVLRQVWRIAHEDGRDVIVEKVRAGLSRLGMDPDRWAPFLLVLFGVPLDASRAGRFDRAELQRQGFDALRRVALATSQQAPLIIEVEDLQEFGRTANEFLSYLVDNVPSARILLLTTYRPEYCPTWLGKSYVTQLTVPPLSLEESRAVLHSALLAPRPSEQVIDAILDKAEGNPFFIEQLARNMPATAPPGLELPVPEPIRELLSARLARLGAQARRLLQVASAIGRRVPARLLEAVCEDLRHLPDRIVECKRLELLREEIVDGEPVYVFQHALVQQVAWESLSPLERESTRRAAGLNS